MSYDHIETLKVLSYKSRIDCNEKENKLSEINRKKQEAIDL